MTATATETQSTGAAGEGRISRVIGPVVDIEFPAGSIPDIYQALEIDYELGGEKRTLMPRTRPSVGFIAMARTMASPMCWATSSTSVRFSPPSS